MYPCSCACQHFRKATLQAPFSLIHLAPTLLGAVNAPIPASFQGQSCWEQISTGRLLSEPAIAECVDGCNNPFRVDDRMRSRLLAVRDHACKLVINFREKVDYLYDLKNDPGERSPLPVWRSARDRARLLQVARVHLQKTRHDQNADLRVHAISSRA